MVDTNYTEYALVLKHKKMEREYTQVALYGESGARVDGQRVQSGDYGKKWAKTIPLFKPCGCHIAGRRG